MTEERLDDYLVAHPDDVNFDEIEDSINHSLESLQYMDKTLAVLEHLMDLRDVHEGKQQISQEEFKLTKISLEMAVAGTDYSCNDLVPGYENWINNFSIEDIDNSIKKNIANIEKTFIAETSDLFSNIKLIFKFFDFTEGSLKKLEQKVKTDGVKKSEIKFKKEKFLFRGHTPIDNIGDYVKYFTEDMDIIRKVMIRSLEYQKDNVFQGMRTLFKAFSSKKYVDLIKGLDNFINDIIRLAGMSKSREPIVKPIHENKYPNEYMSDFFLGKYFIYARKGTPENIEYSKKFINEQRYFITIDRDDFDKEALKDEITISNIDDKSLLKIIEVAITTIKEYKKSFGLISRLSTMHALSDYNEYLSTKSNPLLSVRLLVSNYRMLVRVSIAVLNTAAVSLKVAKQNISFAEKLVKKAL